MTWNSERSLVLSHVLLTKMLSILRARDILTRISRRKKIWERVLHTGLVGNIEAEGSARR